MLSNSDAFKKISSTVYSRSQQTLFCQAFLVCRLCETTWVFYRQHKIKWSQSARIEWKLDLAGRIVCWTWSSALKLLTSPLPRNCSCRDYSDLHVPVANFQPHTPCPPVVFASCSLLESIFPWASTMFNVFLPHPLLPLKKIFKDGFPIISTVLRTAEPCGSRWLFLFTSIHSHGLTESWSLKNNL